MRNLTRRDIRLTPFDGGASSVLPRSGLVAAAYIGENIATSAGRDQPGVGRLRTATLTLPTEPEIQNLDRLLEEQVFEDAAATDGDGLVIVDRNVLDHVHPRLRGHVAAVTEEDGESTLVFAAPPRTVPGKPPEHKGYTLLLDQAGLGTSNPTTKVLGHAHTWEQLQWMARGAEHLERGCRLWGLDEETRTVLSLADMRRERHVV